MEQKQDRFLERSLASVDWGDIRAGLARYCQTALGREAAGALAPDLSQKAVERGYALSAAARACGEALMEIELMICDQVSELFGVFDEGAVFEPKELLTWSDFLTLRSRIERACKPVFGDFAEFKRFLSHDYDRPAKVRAIESRISGFGDVLPDASPKLAELSRYEAADRVAIEKALDGVIKKSQFQDMLMERYVTLRDGRYVLPVKIQFQNQVKGVIHDVSNSQKTAFIEPFQIVKINNHLIQVLEAKQEERHKILRHLTNMLKACQRDLERDLQDIAALDVLRAKLKLGASWGGILIEARPQPPDGGRARGGGGGGGGGGAAVKRPEIFCESLRHPMLVLKGEKVVPNDVRVAPDEVGLVISGPNMGGKTVLLKSIGCALLLSYCGIPVPCGENTVLPLFDWMRFVIGDQQSVEQGVSSFTFQVEMLKDLPAGARGGAGLLIVDEIMASTDPEEGEALARALIESWLTRPNVRCLVSTHYSRVKSMGAAGAYPLAFGSMGYARGRPTYQFLAESWGHSFGIETALAQGMDAAIVEEAKKMIGTDTIEMNQLISALQHKVAAAAQSEDELKRFKAELAKKESAYEQKMSEIEDERNRVEAETVERVYQEYEAVLAEVHALIEDERKRRDEAALRESEKRLTTAVVGLRDRLADIVARQLPQKGDWYFIGHLGKVQILEWHEDKKYAVVKCKTKTIRLSFEHFAKARKL